MFDYTKIINTASKFLRTKALFKLVPDMGDTKHALSFDEAVSLWKVADRLLDAIKSRKEDLREYLLDYAMEHGESTDKGGHVFQDERFRVVRERRISKAPDEKAFRTLLKEREIPLTEAFDETRTLVYSPSKVQFLVDTGKIEEGELHALRKVSFALKVEAPEDFDQIAF